MNVSQIAKIFTENSDFHGSVKTNEPLSSHTTMHVGGVAKIFVEPTDEESLVFSVKFFIEKNVRFFVLGGGSNVIVSDAGLDAVISTRKMCLIRRGLTRINADVTDDTDITDFYEKNYPQNLLNPSNPRRKFLRVSAGSSWGSVISFCKKENLGGFESFSGLSGTVGGAIFMNATCFGFSACDNLVSVEYLDLRDLAVHTYEKVDSDWGYKKSPFQGGANGESCAKDYRGGFRQAQPTPDNDGGILASKFETRGIASGGVLRPPVATRISDEILAESLASPRLHAGFSDGDFKGQSPLGEGVAEDREVGCSEGETSPFVILSAIFRVHEGFDSEKAEKCILERREKGHFLAPSSGSAFKNDAAHGIIAGKVIDECGLKGFSVGGAQIAPWHGNFIINPEQKATAQDIKTLSDEVKKIVREKTGIVLENEIIFVGF